MLCLYFAFSSALFFFIQFTCPVPLFHNKQFHCYRFSLFFVHFNCTVYDVNWRLQRTQTMHNYLVFVPVFIFWICIEVDNIMRMEQLSLQLWQRLRLIITRARFSITDPSWLNLFDTDADPIALKPLHKSKCEEWCRMLCGSHFIPCL